MGAVCSLGFDFGTESVRVLVVETRNGQILGQAAHAYAHGVIDQTLPQILSQLAKQIDMRWELDGQPPIDTHPRARRCRQRRGRGTDRAGRSTRIP